MKQVCWYTKPNTVTCDLCSVSKVTCGKKVLLEKIMTARQPYAQMAIERDLTEEENEEIKKIVDDLIAAEIENPSPEPPKKSRSAKATSEKTVAEASSEKAAVTTPTAKAGPSKATSGKISSVKTPSAKEASSSSEKRPVTPTATTSKAAVPPMSVKTPSVKTSVKDTPTTKPDTSTPTATTKAVKSKSVKSPSVKETPTIVPDAPTPVPALKAGAAPAKSAMASRRPSDVAEGSKPKPRPKSLERVQPAKSHRGASVILFDNSLLIFAGLQAYVDIPVPAKKRIHFEELAADTPSGSTSEIESNNLSEVISATGVANLNIETLHREFLKLRKENSELRSHLHATDKKVSKLTDSVASVTRMQTTMNTLVATVEALREETREARKEMRQKSETKEVEDTEEIEESEDEMDE